MATFEGSFTIAENGHKQNKACQNAFTRIYTHSISYCVLSETLYFPNFQEHQSHIVHNFSIMHIQYCIQRVTVHYTDVCAPVLTWPISPPFPSSSTYSTSLSTITLHPIASILSFQGWQAGHKS